MGQGWAHGWMDEPSLDRLFQFVQCAHMGAWMDGMDGDGDRGWVDG